MQHCGNEERHPETLWNGSLESRKRGTCGLAGRKRGGGRNQLSGKQGAGLAVAPFALEAFTPLLPRNLGKAVVLGAKPDFAGSAVLGVVLVQVWTGALRLGRKFSVDRLSHASTIIRETFSD